MFGIHFITCLSVIHWKNIHYIILATSINTRGCCKALVQLQQTVLCQFSVNLKMK